MKIRVIVTGATGMVGEGVLLECLGHDSVEHVLVIGRRSCERNHPKLEEILVEDLADLSSVTSRLKNYDGCFFCAGVSSVGMKEEKYYRLTYTLTMEFAKNLAAINPGMTFCYVSGGGTDSSEKGRMMWARVKGKTENDLAKLPFKSTYNFRLGMARPSAGMKNVLPLYRYLGWLAPLISAVAPNIISTLKELGLAMINAVLKGYEKNILEVKDIKKLAKE
jgi:uncharacterized protein YbjT (DUF2867 family)